MREIAKKSPQANELAMPRIIGLSRQEVQKVGIIPAMRASKKTKIMKQIWSTRTPLSLVSSSSDESKICGCILNQNNSDLAFEVFDALLMILLFIIFFTFYFIK